MAGGDGIVEQKTGVEPISNKPDKWQEVAAAVFVDMGMPEVAQEQLRPGDYTNAEIIEGFRDESLGLLISLNELRELAEKSHGLDIRRVLSFALDKKKEKENKEG
jgi:hypothetical protein